MGHVRYVCPKCGHVQYEYGLCEGCDDAMVEVMVNKNFICDTCGKIYSADFGGGVCPSCGHRTVRPVTDFDFEQPEKSHIKPGEANGNDKKKNNGVVIAIIAAVIAVVLVVMLILVGVGYIIFNASKTKAMDGVESIKELTEDRAYNNYLAEIDRLGVILDNIN